MPQCFEMGHATPGQRLITSVFPLGKHFQTLDAMGSSTNTHHEANILLWYRKQSQVSLYSISAARIAVSPKNIFL